MFRGGRGGRVGGGFLDDVPVATIDEEKSRKANPFPADGRRGLEGGGGGGRAVVIDVEAELDLRGGGARKGLAGAGGRGSGRGSPKAIATEKPEKKESGDFGFLFSFFPPSLFEKDLDEGMKDIPAVERSSEL